LKRWLAAGVAGLLVVAGAGVWALNARRGGEASSSSYRQPSDVPGRSPQAEQLPEEAFLRDACRRLPPEWVRLIDRGWVRGGLRDGDLIIVPTPPNYVGTFINTSHSGPYDFLQQVPLIFYGPGLVKNLGPFEPGREVTLADIAPTYGALMDYDFSQRSGAPITELLEDTPAHPKLIVTVSIDGGGWNVLNRWPDSWPNLKGLIDAGASVKGAIAGSSPSITPAIHTNISTGTWPREHGVTAIAIRGDDGVVTGAFTQSVNDTGSAVTPTLHLAKTTIGDRWDRHMGNAALVGMAASGNYTLGMIGRGSLLEGGDKDIVAFVEEQGAWGTDPRYYSLPGYLSNTLRARDAAFETLDRRDGAADGRWLGHDLDEVGFGKTPAVAPWEEQGVERILAEEGFGADDVTDLFYVHFKSPDHVGHTWNMISPEEKEVLASVDAAIGKLQSWMEANLDPESYVLVVTADHGQTPLDAGGWPINRDEMLGDIERRFDSIDNDLGIVQRSSATSLFSNVDEMSNNNVSPEDVSSYLSRYTIEDNIPEGQRPPKEFAGRVGERVFTAVFPGRDLQKVLGCTGA
jgi:Type I phosphodiesterase / nucleotide pyrophosphatase